MPILEDRLTDATIWMLFDDEYPESPAAGLPARAWDATGRRWL